MPPYSAHMASTRSFNPAAFWTKTIRVGSQPVGGETVDARGDPPDGWPSGRSTSARWRGRRRARRAGRTAGQVLAGVHLVADREDVLGLAAGLEPVEHPRVQPVGHGAGAEADQPPLVGGASGQPAAGLEQAHHLGGHLGRVLDVDVLEHVVGDDEVEGAVVEGQRLARRHHLRLVERGVAEHDLVDVGPDDPSHAAAQHPQPARDRGIGSRAQTRRPRRSRGHGCPRPRAR